MTNKKYNYSEIRQQFDMAFDDSELNAFCLDYFSEVYDKFTGGMRKDDKITLLLDYCRRRGTGFETLLENVRKEYAEKAEQGNTSNLENLHLKPLIEALEAPKHGGRKATDGSPRTHTEPKTPETSPPQLPSWAIAAGGIIVLFVGIFFVMMVINPPASSNPIVNGTTPSPTTPSPTIAPSTTPSPTIPSPTNTPTPSLGIGSTMISEKDGMTLLYVPEGEFQMGSAEDDPLAYHDEKPRHKVYLDAYWIDKTEVTNAMFATFVEERGHQTEAEKEGFGWIWSGSDWEKVEEANWLHPQGPQSDITELGSHPVVQVSWNDASAYCQWVERRLPTEAEWEKAAGGRDSRKYPWGSEAPNDDLLNFCDQNCPFSDKDLSTNDDYQFTSPVGNYSAGASPYGALDMAGNAWEWVNDNYASDYYEGSPDKNPRGPASSNSKVLRGGSWTNRARDIRARNRHMFKGSERGEGGGFRCAVSDK